MAMHMASNGNGATGGFRLLSMRSLVHRQKLTKAQRALIGAAIIEGHVQPCDLPQRVVAELVGCSVAYLGAAQKLSPAARQAVHQGQRPLISPRTSCRGRWLPRPCSWQSRQSEHVDGAVPRECGAVPFS
jgi:hypothetical protein